MANGAEQLAAARADRLERRQWLRGRPFPHQNEREAGEQHPPHRDADERPSDRLCRVGQPEPARLLDHGHVQGEQHAAPQVAERIAVAGYEVVLALYGDIRQQRVVELIAAPESEGGHDIQHRSGLPVPLADEIQPTRHHGAQEREEAEQAHARSSLVGDRPHQGRHERHDETRHAVGDPEPEGALGRHDASVPVLLEEQWEEARHHGRGERRVGPVAHRPAEYRAAQQYPGHARARARGNNAASFKSRAPASRGKRCPASARASVRG